jgi:hypothetical protein
MINLALLALLGQPDGEPVVARIVAASLFKNGYSMVTREIPVSGGMVSLSEIPQASLGTFWVAASEGVKVKELVSTEEPVSSPYTASSLDQLLQLNLGRQMELLTVNLGTKVGKLRVIGSDILIFETEGKVISIPRGEVRMVTLGLDSKFTGTAQTTRRVLRFKTVGKGTLTIYGLERGMSWVPGYAIDLTDPKTLTLTAKSTVLDDLGDLQNVELRFVTGFPSVPWATLTEPLLSAQSVDQFTGFLNSIGSGPDRDAFKGRREMSGQMMNQAASADFTGAFDPSQLPGEQAEDLFFYRQPGVTLKRGDRALYMLFEAKSDYEHLYKADLADSGGQNDAYQPMPEGPTDVWHTIKFKNTAGQPLTTGPATVYQRDQVVGQDTMTYTTAGAEATITISKALDIRMEGNEEETGRERQVKLANGNYYDLVTIKGTATVRNMKKDTVSMKITKVFTGDLISASAGGKETKLAKGLRDVNPRTRIVWEPKVTPGQKLELTYSYKIYVRV